MWKIEIFLAIAADVTANLNKCNTKNVGSVSWTSMIRDFQWYTYIPNLFGFCFRHTVVFQRKRHSIYWWRAWRQSTAAWVTMETCGQQRSCVNVPILLYVHAHEPPVPVTGIHAKPVLAVLLSRARRNRYYWKWCKKSQDSLLCFSHFGENDGNLH